MSKSAIRIEQFGSSAEHEHLIPQIVNLHIACIQHDNSLLRFHPPFDDHKRSRMTAFWTDRLSSVRTGASTLLLAFPEDSSSSPFDLAGMGELITPNADTGPFRGKVELVMVSPAYQRRGIARQIMREIEAVAQRKGRTLLRLGTTKDSVADLYLYPRIGYVKIGEVPGYGIEPNSGRLVDGVEYYKHLTPPDGDS